MLAFLRDYIIYLWNVLFKQTQPVSGALTNEEPSNTTDNNSSHSSTDIPCPIASVDKKDKLEDSKPESEQTQTPATIETKNTNSFREKPLKPADLSYFPTSPAQQEIKQIPPEPSRPPPALSESKYISKATPPSEVPKPVLPTPPLSEVSAALSQETIPVSTRSPVIETKSIPSTTKSETIEAKSSSLLSASPGLKEISSKSPGILQDVEQEGSKIQPLVDEEDYNYEDEFEDEEIEEDIDDYDDHLEEQTNLHPQLLQTKQDPKIENSPKKDIPTDIK